MQIERVSKQDRIYKFEHCIELYPQESIAVWRWNVAGDFGYLSARYYKPCGYHLKKNLHKYRRPTPRTPDKCQRCNGKGYFLIGSDECRCPNCNSGICG